MRFIYITIPNSRKVNKYLQRWTRKCVKHASVWSSSNDEDVHIVSALGETDRNFAISELVRETGLPPSTELHILRNRFRMRKIVLKWVPHDITELKNIGHNTGRRYQCSLAVLRERRRNRVQILRSKTETSIERVASLMVTENQQLGITPPM